MQAHTQKLARNADGTASTSSPRGSGFVQFPAANYVPAKMTMQAVYPRPDTETSANARHRHLLPSLPYRIPIIIQGGAFPFGYTLGANHTLPGSSIGEFLTFDTDNYVVGDDYGVLHGTAPASGTYDVHIVVRDQDGTTRDVEWRVTVSDANFVFCDFNAVGSANTGTFDDPFTNATSVWGATSSTVVNAGKIAVFKAGTHVMTGHGGNTNTIIPDLSKNPGNVLGYPGTTPVLDMKTGNNNQGMAWNLPNSVCSDVAFQNVVFDGNTSETPNGMDTYQFYGGGLWNRVNWLECEFRNWERYGHNGGANPGVIYLAGADKSHTNISRCTMGGTTNGPFCIYNWYDSVVEHLTTTFTDFSEALANSGPTIVYTKQNGRRLSWRNLDVGQGVTNWGDAGRMPVGVREQNGESYDIEICYSRLWGRSSVSSTIMFQNGPRDIDVYRCNVDRGINPDDGLYENVVVEKTVSDNVGISANMDNGDNVIQQSALDSDLNLTGAARAIYLGTRGAEVAA